MRKIFFFLFIFFIFCENTFSQKDSTFSVQYFNPVPNISIRALAALSDSKAWFAANRGAWGYTEDAGKIWHTDSIKVDSIYPQFRSISVLNDSTVLLLSIASPAYLFKTTNNGKTWRLVYKNVNKDVFFDSMIFSDSKQGIAIGDPIEGCIQIIKTNDGGETWKQIDCGNIPKVEQGESCFATSNTNIDISGKNIWIATGGKRSRVFHSQNLGNHFETYDSPIPQGEKMTGIFSLDFYNESTGVIGGGNYDKTDSSIVSLAVTHNGGKTWKPIKNKKPFFGSCVQFKSSNEIFVTGHDGTFFYTMKTEKITEIKDKEGASLNFNTLRFSSSKKVIWLAGNNGAIALIYLNRNDGLKDQASPSIPLQRRGK